MSHTSDFLKLQIDTDKSPTQAQIYFERVAIDALNNCQASIDRDQSKLTEAEIQPKDNASILFKIDRELKERPGSFPDLIRVEAYSAERQTELINSMLSNGHQFVSAVTIYQPGTNVQGSAMYFTKQGQSVADFKASHVDTVRAQIETQIESRKAMLKQSQDDMRTLKKAVQARQAQIPTFSKRLAEF